MSRRRQVVVTPPIPSSSSSLSSLSPVPSDIDNPHDHDIDQETPNNNHDQQLTKFTRLSHVGKDKTTAVTKPETKTKTTPKPSVGKIKKSQEIVVVGLQTPTKSKSRLKRRRQDSFVQEEVEVEEEGLKGVVVVNSVVPTTTTADVATSVGGILITDIATETVTATASSDTATATVKVERKKIKVDTKNTALSLTEEEEQSGSVSNHKKGKSIKEADEIETEKDKEDTKPKKKRRKTKEEKEAGSMPLAERTIGLGMLVGAHVSAAKGVQNAVTNALHIGGNAFALFLKSQRKWENPPIKEPDAKMFTELSGKSGYDVKRHVLPHGSYLVNLAGLDKDKAQKSYDGFLDDLQRCEKLGIGLFNFHPGSTGGEPRPDAIARLADALNRAHSETKFVKTLLENMANQTTILGGRFEDLRDVIELVEDKQRVGVCIDTCHAFAAGYDLRSPESFSAVLDDFDKIVGMKYLSALHLNDSKTPLSSGRDLHENIGVGFIGLRGFWNVMNEKRFAGMPLILETPYAEDIGVKQWAEEIKLLESLVGLPLDSPEFIAKERELSEKGAAARAIAQEKHDKKISGDKKAKPQKSTKTTKTKKKDGNITKMFGKTDAKVEKMSKAKKVLVESESDSDVSSCAGREDDDDDDDEEEEEEEKEGSDEEDKEEEMAEKVSKKPNKKNKKTTVKDKTVVTSKEKKDQVQVQVKRSGTKGKG